MCRYRVGDLLLNLSNFISVLALAALVLITVPDLWMKAVAGVVLLISPGSMLLGAALNKRERDAEALQNYRDTYQISLGVPPEEL